MFKSSGFIFTSSSSSSSSSSSFVVGVVPYCFEWVHVLNNAQSAHKLLSVFRFCASSSLHHLNLAFAQLFNAIKILYVSRDRGKVERKTGGIFIYRNWCFANTTQSQTNESHTFLWMGLIAVPLDCIICFDIHDNSPTIPTKNLQTLCVCARARFFALHVVLIENGTDCFDVWNWLGLAKRLLPNQIRNLLNGKITVRIIRLAFV